MIQGNVFFNDVPLRVCGSCLRFFTPFSRALCWSSVLSLMQIYLRVKIMSGCFTTIMAIIVV